MIALTFDLETENHTLHKRKASPFDERNYIVQIGWSVNGGQPQEKYYTEHHRDDVLPVDVLEQMGEGDIIIGFNIKFDLLWVWQEKPLQDALKRGVRIYCGQYVEYLLGGMVQEVQMCAMNDIAESYGGGCKIDAVKEMWEDGMLTSQIPRDLLTDYLIGDGKGIVGDVHNTWLIYCGQVARIKEEMPLEFRTMLKHRMDGLLATTEMEHNGMHVDEEVAEDNRLTLVKDLEEASVELNSFIPELPEELIFNWNSNVHKSCLIFGGVAKYTKWTAHKDDNGNPIFAKKKESWPMFELPKVTQHEKLGEVVTTSTEAVPLTECIKAGDLYVLPVPEGTWGAFEHNGKSYLTQIKYKGGKQKGSGKFKQVSVPDETKPKGAQQPYYFKFDGYTKPHPAWRGELTDAYDQPLYSTSGDVIEKLAQRGLPFTTALSKHTAMAKDLGTYYWTEDKKGKRKGMLTLVNDGIIHHKLNHTSTVTSRMSSSDPNLQNVPRGNTSNVKKMFTTRFEDGEVAEIDYSQLEVVIQGVLSKDPQLCTDLRNKVDFHCKRLAAKLDRPYEEIWKLHHEVGDPDVGLQRTKAKEFSFKRAYGAGVAAVVASTGMSKDAVEALVEAENKLYPKVADFDKRLERDINLSRIPTSKKIFLEGIAFTQGEGHWDSPTGTRYIWREGITPTFMHEHGKYTGFSPTERKNYPVQGFGGEVVQTMLGKVFRYFLENDRFDGDVLLMNTVHDCVLLDGKQDKLRTVAKEVQTILESVPEVFNKAFPKLNIDVPFPCETEVGKDLFTMEVLH